MSAFRTNCRWHLYVHGYHWCRRLAFDNPRASLDRLDMGCNCNEATDYQPQEWKGKPDPAVDLATLEWEEET